MLEKSAHHSRYRHGLARKQCLHVREVFLPLKRRVLDHGSWLDFSLTGNYVQCPTCTTVHGGLVIGRHPYLITDGHFPLLLPGLRSCARFLTSVGAHLPKFSVESWIRLSSIPREADSVQDIAMRFGASQRAVFPLVSKLPKSPLS